jgi:predicted nucleic acid-binding protein
MFIIPDTSIWVDHLRNGEPQLVNQLDRNLVAMHAFVIGELACGNLRTRETILALLQALPRVSTASEDEVLWFIERHQLMGKGVGYVDVHLLAATAMDGNAKLWTRDKRLYELAAQLNLAAVL